MKTKMLKSMLMGGLGLLLMGWVFSSCLGNREEQDTFSTREATILSKTELKPCCVPFPSPTEVEMMVINWKNGDTAHLPLTSIKGFTYEQGYEYELLIKVKHLATPPADGSSEEYYLIKEISKKKVEN